MKQVTWKTSLIALGISAVGALGLDCVMLYLGSTAFGEAHTHPIAHPASVTVGLISYQVALLLLWLYVRERAKCPSVQGVVADVLLTLLCLVPFVFLWDWLFQIASALV